MYLIVDKNGKAHWSQTPSLSDKCRNIDMNKLIEMLDYLIDNIFIRVGNKVFRQTIGIPMGTDCAPLLANLFLFYYEYNHYMKNLIRDNQCLAKSFNYTVRYIHVDDLLTFINNHAYIIVNLACPCREPKTLARGFGGLGSGCLPEPDLGMKLLTLISIPYPQLPH